MGASNFARGNASKVFAVLMDTEEKYSKCAECAEKVWEWEENYIEEGQPCSCGCTEIEHDTEYRSAEDFEFDDLKYNLKEIAENKAGIFKYREESGSDNARQYTATDLFSYSISKYYGDIEVDVKITGQIVNAYYEGASLDFRFEIYNGGEWSQVENGCYKVTVADIIQDLFETKYNNHTYSDMSKGLRTILYPKAINWAEKTKTEMVDLVEEIFTEVSMPLVVTAQFSNGETFYEKA